MTARIAILLATFLAPSTLLAQPVTVGEANVVLDRVDASVRKVLGLSAAKPSTDRSSKPVTRAQVLARLDLMFETYRPKFLLTPRPMRSEPGIVEKHNSDPKVRAVLNKFVRYGCVGPVGPLVVGPGETLSTQDFGDAVGFFMSQIAALTYKSDREWTPHLVPPS